MPDVGIVQFAVERNSGFSTTTSGYFIIECHPLVSYPPLLAVRSTSHGELLAGCPAGPVGGRPA